MFVKIVVKSDKRVIAEKAMLADSFFKRLKGLMFSKKMDGYDALILNPCNSIHTFFMKYSIDVVFLNKESKIIKIKRGLRPWRTTPIYWFASQVIEFAVDCLDKKLQEGDELEFVCIN